MIECNPLINFGQPALKGRRLTVYDIVTKLYYEDTIEMALDDYSISLTDAEDAVAYCKSLKCRSEQRLLHYCDGCLLRTFAEGISFGSNEFIDNQGVIMSKDGKILYSGTVDEFENSEFGKATWLMAEEIFRKLGYP